MRVAVIDIGTNSTRLLVADVDTTCVVERERRSQVTRLGTGVDASGALSEEAIGRVLETLDLYVETIAAERAQATAAVLTSAVRDATNGAEFADEVRRRYGLDARVIDGEEEGRLTFLGATSERGDDRPEPVLVVDIGGGSTELVLGSGGEPTFHTSLQTGVVRQTERHLQSDPPAPEELQAVADDVRSTVEATVPAEVRRSAAAAIAVAGTPTSLAAIDQELDPYDPARVHGYTLWVGTCELLLARLAAMPLEERRAVRGLHPDRAAMIVTGTIILLDVLRAFELDQVEVSEHDLMRGAALRLARADDGGDLTAEARSAGG